MNGADYKAGNSAEEVLHKKAITREAVPRSKVGEGQTIVLLREQKVPAELRAPFTPGQVKELLALFPGLEIRVQPCPNRCFTDSAYENAGALLTDSVAGATYLLGIKERKAETLVPGAHYLIFSHTIKQQPYNQDLLATLLERECSLTDWESITSPTTGERLIAFGYFAGVVGALHSLRMVGLARKTFFVQAPMHYASLRLALHDLWHAPLAGLRVVVTGQGRVSGGAVAVLKKLGFMQLSPAAFAAGEELGAAPVYTQLASGDLYHKPGEAWQGSAAFYADPIGYESRFAPYMHSADVLITGAYWQPGYPRLFELEALADPSTRLRLIGDVSCDIAGAVPITHRATSTAMPYYDYNPATGAEEESFSNPANLTVMSVDNLPCEMPAEATEHFGAQLIAHFMADLFSRGPLAQHAQMVANGHLLPRFQYLEEWAAPERQLRQLS
jgi:saccharopine dehydrogenase (NAD+, L-lysine forming)